MASDRPNTTILRAPNTLDPQYADAEEALDVGDLAELTADGTIQAHSTPAEQAHPITIVLEARESGMVIDDADDAGYDVYEAGELTKYLRGVDGGEQFNLNLAAGETVTANETKLVSNGDGKLRAIDTAGGDDEGGALFIAKEDRDLSGADEFGKVRVELLS